MGNARLEREPMKKYEDLPTELGKMMRAWRMNNNMTVTAAADHVHIAKSTWSDIENGNRPVSLETAKAISLALGVSLDDLTRAAGQPLRRSSNPQERVERALAASEVIPGLGQLLDLFPELLPDEVDMLLTSAESLVRRRRRKD